MYVFFIALVFRSVSTGNRFAKPCARTVTTGASALIAMAAQQRSIVVAFSFSDAVIWRVQI
jgi:hypothetical protein